MLTRAPTRPLAGSFLFLMTLAPAFAADPPADGALKEKGLRKAGATYVLPAEADVQKRLNAARNLYRTAGAAAAQKAEYDYQVREMEQQVVGLNQQLAQGGLSIQENNRVVAMINALNGQLRAIGRPGGEDLRQVAGARLASAREGFIQAVLDLRQFVDTTNGRYAELAADADVKAALDGLNRSSKAKVTLGPSKTYQANVKLLERVEASVLTEDIALRKEGGVYWVDATFNGKVTRPMVFDTGASDVVLPAELAAEIGLKPGPDTPSVVAQVADGSKVNAHRMTIPSVRVGKFTVADVECIIMPAGKHGVHPLLGQTFQRNFSIKLNADAGKLVLSKLETGDADTAAANANASSKGKAKAKPGRGRRPAAGTDGGPSR